MSAGGELTEATPPGGRTAAVTGAEFQQARVELGTVFGTKKAQAAIRAAARNKVDVNAMRGVADHLQARIEVQTKALPSKGTSF